MLEDIESITSEYLYHCEITNFTNGYSGSIWWANKLIGKRYFYDKTSNFMEVNSYNIKNGSRAGRSEVWSKNVLEKITIYDKHGNLKEVNNYYEDGTRGPRIIYHNSTTCRDEIWYHSNGNISSLTQYNNNTKTSYTVWDFNGDQLYRYNYAKSRCLIL